MMFNSQPSNEFLTPDECAEVDKALLTARDKFTVRVAVYALRSLKQIAQANGRAISELTPAEVEDWVYQDFSLEEGLDREFKKFFSHLVIASMSPLQRAATSVGTRIEDLTLAQLITWFEQDAKQALTDPTNSSN